LDGHEDAQAAQRNSSGRPRNEYFQNRMLQVAKQTSSGNEAVAEDVISHHAALSQYAIRPPSRHKDPPQNQGLGEM
jgi:hypothetical protein